MGAFNVPGSAGETMQDQLFAGGGIIQPGGLLCADLLNQPPGAKAASEYYFIGPTH